MCIHHFQVPTIVDNSLRRAASRRSPSAGIFEEDLEAASGGELEAQGTRSSSRPPPISSDTEDFAAAEPEIDGADLDASSGDSDEELFPEKISRDQVSLAFHSAADTS